MLDKAENSCTGLKVVFCWIIIDKEYFKNPPFFLQARPARLSLMGAAKLE